MFEPIDSAAATATSRRQTAAARDAAPILSSEDEDDESGFSPRLRFRLAANARSVAEASSANARSQETAKASSFTPSSSTAFAFCREVTTRRAARTIAPVAFSSAASAARSSGSPANVFNAESAARHPASSHGVRGVSADSPSPKAETHSPAEAAASLRASREDARRSTDEPSAAFVSPERCPASVAQRCASAKGANAAAKEAGEPPCSALFAKRAAETYRPSAAARTISSSGCAAIPARTGATRALQISARTARGRSSARAVVSAKRLAANARGHAEGKGMDATADAVALSSVR